jgi:hypothetical protein
MSGHGKTNGGRKFRVKLRAFGCSQTRISPGGETARAMKSETRKIYGTGTDGLFAALRPS